MSNPAQLAESNCRPQPNGSSRDPYQELHSYLFTADPEFKLGLAMILRQPGIPATDEQINRTDELVLRAKCFYFSRKNAIQPPLDFVTYKAWLQSHPSDDSQCQAQSQDQSSTPSAQTAPSAPPLSPNATTTQQQQEPTYPSSFAHIVELITTGQPIPGIQQIPDTILTGHEGPSTATRRRKPWEELEESSEKREIQSEGGGGDSKAKDRDGEDIKEEAS
ncbi:hypothetical protein PRK78_001774 [Emydomyces testavorans]|uniref:Uncharacterized protein n=1 Tax=Emydomyces testavorans TaxID=2070801 RepID=A0AAF0DEP8_9EURO|nr:hypothetical protein PRK78_001774 [Emydomyces testavorans]